MELLVEYSTGKCLIDEFDEVGHGNIELLVSGEFRNSTNLDWNTTVRWEIFNVNSREELGTYFHFFAPDKDPVIIKPTNFSKWDINGSGFNETSPTIFILHADSFKYDTYGEWIVLLKDALIKEEKCNVFIVEWGNKMCLGDVSEMSSLIVGAEVGLFIQRLMTATKLSPSRIHLIGHDLGAHIAGYAGRWFTGKTKKKIGRITGLNPSGILSFYLFYTVVKLDVQDATFVDVIHTSYGTLYGGYGLKEPMGHFDFYPNGNSNQTGCLTSDYVEFCGHRMVHHYFLYSISDKDCKFEAVLCDSWERYENGSCGTCKDDNCVQMGYYADRYKELAKTGASPKIFYLKTTVDEPFCVEKKTNGLNLN